MQQGAGLDEGQQLLDVAPEPHQVWRHLGYKLRGKRYNHVGGAKRHPTLKIVEHRQVRLRVGGAGGTVSEPVEDAGGLAAGLGDPDRQHPCFIFSVQLACRRDQQTDRAFPHDGDGAPAILGVGSLDRGLVNDLALGDQAPQQHCGDTGFVRLQLGGFVYADDLVCEWR